MGYRNYKYTVCLALLYLLGCFTFSIKAQSSKVGSSTASVANAWADLTEQLMTQIGYNTPTYGSRALGYRQRHNLLE